MFFTGKDSPVNIASLTSIVPSLTMASADIWFPFVSTTKSSNTISSVFIETAAPSLITVAVGAVTSLNLSIVF